MTREEAIEKRDIIVTQFINELGITIETNTKPLIHCKGGMTREEAIKKINAIKKYLITGNPMWDVKEIDEALDMAIEAIQNEDREDYEKVMEILREMPRLLIGIKEKQIKKPSEAVEIVRFKECRRASECHKVVALAINAIGAMMLWLIGSIKEYRCDKQ